MTIYFWYLVLVKVSDTLYFEFGCCCCNCMVSGLSLHLFFQLDSLSFLIRVKGNQPLTVIVQNSLHKSFSTSFSYLVESPSPSPEPKLKPWRPFGPFSIRAYLDDSSRLYLRLNCLDRFLVVFKLSGALTVAFTVWKKQNALWPPASEH